MACGDLIKMRHSQIFTNALAQKVLAVAKVNYEDGILFDWGCYINAVPGQDHDLEKDMVARHGTKQGPELAVFLFPHLPSDKYRR